MGLSGDDVPLCPDKTKTKLTWKVTSIKRSTHLLKKLLLIKGL